MEAFELKVTSLELSHFRSYKYIKFECDAPLVAFYGANGSGKTNILEAISLFSPGRGLRRAKTDQLMRQSEALGWKVAASLEAGHTTAQKELSLETRFEGGGGASNFD